VSINRGRAVDGLNFAAPDVMLFHKERQYLKNAAGVIVFSAAKPDQALPAGNEGLSRLF
jgi:hypothetical protein